MPETTCALNSWSLLFCARWMRPASSGLFCAMFSRMAACIAAPSAFMPADAWVVATAVVVFFMVLAFQCCSFLLPITIHSMACECKSFSDTFYYHFSGFGKPKRRGGVADG